MTSFEKLAARAPPAKKVLSPEMMIQGRTGWGVGVDFVLTWFRLSVDRLHPGSAHPETGFRLLFPRPMGMGGG